MQDLEETLKEAADARMRLIVTDGEYTSLLLSHAVCTSIAWCTWQAPIVQATNAIPAMRIA